MALEAVQAQAGHASIESTRIYLHLADDWLASQYRKAAEVIDAQVFADHPTRHQRPAIGRCQAAVRCVAADLGAARPRVRSSWTRCAAISSRSPACCGPAA